VQLEAINRSDVAVKFKSARLLANAPAENIETELKLEQLFTKKIPLKLPETLPFSQPYWLRERGTGGTFAVADQTLIGRPENPPPFPVEFTLEIGGQEIVYNIEPRFRKVDRVEGETNQPLVIAPPVFVDLPRPSSSSATTNRRRSTSASSLPPKKSRQRRARGAGRVEVEPASRPIELHGAESETTLVFQVTPAAHTGEATLRAFFAPASGQRVEAFSRTRIEYPHIEPQTLISPAQAKAGPRRHREQSAACRLSAGRGDSIPESLTDIASEVKMLEDREVKADNLARYDAIVIGVRASNAHPNRVSAGRPELLAYAKNGGVVIMQYTPRPARSRSICRIR
jgi:hypothetical protein